MLNVALSAVRRFVMAAAVCSSRRWSLIERRVNDRGRGSSTAGGTVMNIIVKEDIASIRNIGIIAHIDAGKTTTTERMLFYAGLSRTLGEVDDGDTVTDYMELERERGITITSASVTFQWRRHRINLIDTPGHVDFTMEVERCLRVLDGAVTVLDASVGVQAQTLTVWLKADHYALPRIVFLNKMDKRNADVQLCLASIVNKFPRIKPLVLQLPLRGTAAAGFVGVLDLLSMEKIVWPSYPDRLAGRSFERLQLSAADHLLRDTARKARIQLIEELANIDDRMADVFLRSTAIDASDIAQVELRNAIRRVTIERKAVPVLCGSSYKNIGVQLLLDAIVDYLPSPADSSSAKVGLCALVFKICHDKRMGRLAFVRIYSGTLERGQRVHDVNRRCSERPTKLLRAFADDFQLIDRAGAGDIVVLAGTKNVVTGDTLVSMPSSTREEFTSEAGNVGDERILAGVQVPPPVFFCSIEAASLAHQKPMEVALEQLCVEDPSLRVHLDADTGQTIVSGLGELHMEIVKERLLKEHKVQADFGPLQVAYREVVVFNDCDQSSSTEVFEHVFDKVVSSFRVRILVRMSLDTQRPGNSDKNGVIDTAKVRVRMERTKENQENLAKVRPEHLSALQRGLRSALNNGPILGCPVTNVSTVALHWFEIHGGGGGASTTLVSAVASQCVARLLQSVVVRLSEPLMLLEIVMMADDEMRSPSMGRVLADLSTRRAQLLDVRDVATGNANLVIRALVPLAEVVAYSTALRSITSGKATFTIEYHSYAVMNDHDQRLTVHKVQGFL